MNFRTPVRIFEHCQDGYLLGIHASDVEKKFGLDLSALSNDGKAEKRFDFVFVGAL